MVEHNFISNIAALNKGKLIDFDALELKKLIDEFPCFNSAYIMQAIALKQKSEEAFQEALPSIAVRVLNRAVLYDKVTFNYTSQSVEEIEEPAITKVQNLVENELEEQQETSIEEPTIEALTEKLEISKETTDEVSSFIKEEKVDDELDAIITQSIALANEPITEHTLTPQEELEDLDNLINEVKAKSKKQAIVSKVKKTVKQVEKEPIVEKEKTVDPSIQKLSFTDWLKNKKSIDKSGEPQTQQIKEKINNKVPLDMSTSHEAALMMEVKKSSLKLEDFLVEQIERKQERKEQNKRDFTHAVSETYAKILVKQGKFKEAIDVYKELSIKYPKKSYNFAIQIDNLKNSL